MKAKGERIKSGVYSFSLILYPFSLVAYPFSFILLLLGQSGFINLMRIKSRIWTRTPSRFFVPWCLGGKILCRPKLLDASIDKTASKA